jgi:hypothetical protein
VKKLKISELSLSYVVWVGGRTPLLISTFTFPTRKTKLQLSAGDERSIPALKIIIYILGSYSIPEINFLLITGPKIPPG